MQTEIEAKFLDIDPPSMRLKLKEAGAQLIAAERVMRRQNFDYPDHRLGRQQHAWVRVRDEGGTVTISYKQTNDYTLHGTKEINLTVDSYNAGAKFLEAIGMTSKNRQITKRESWLLNGTQIEIDTWPWIPSFVEIEGENETKVRQVAEALGFNWPDAVFGDVMPVYLRYFDITPEQLYSITDCDFVAVPEWLVAKRREENS